MATCHERHERGQYGEYWQGQPPHERENPPRPPSYQLQVVVVPERRSSVSTLFRCCLALVCFVAFVLLIFVVIPMLWKVLEESSSVFTAQLQPCLKDWLPSRVVVALFGITIDILKRMARRF
mgnify:FL=1